MERDLIRLTVSEIKRDLNRLTVGAIAGDLIRLTESAIERDINRLTVSAIDMHILNRITVNTRIWKEFNRLIALGKDMDQYRLTVSKI